MEHIKDWQHTQSSQQDWNPVHKCKSIKLWQKCVQTLRFNVCGRLCVMSHWRVHGLVSVMKSQAWSQQADYWAQALTDTGYEVVTKFKIDNNKQI